MNESADLADLAADLRLELQQCFDALVMGDTNEVEFVEAVRGKFDEDELADAIGVQLRLSPESKPRLMAVVERLASEGQFSPANVCFLEAMADEAPTRDDNPTIEVKHATANAQSPSALNNQPPETIEIGRVLRERYVIEKRIGSGGKGTVFKALDKYRSSLPAELQYVAIKILHGTTKDREAMVESLRRELYCAQMLSHRNIVNVFELDRDGELDFFTMELLEGELLSNVLARFESQAMHRPHAWAIIQQIAAGLEHAHGRGVVHGDLKPQNIVVTHAGEVRILDFGASVSTKQEANHPDPKPAASATPAYASCEVLAGRTADPRDDLYSLACISYELLSGNHPFQRRRSTEARDFAVVATRPRDLTGRQWKMLTKGLSWHRGGRSISVRDWANRLSPDGDDSQALPGATELKPIRASNPRSGLLFRVAAVSGVLAATVAASILYVRTGHGSFGGAVSSAQAGGRSNAESPTSSGANNAGLMTLAPDSMAAPATQSSTAVSKPGDGRVRAAAGRRPLAVSVREYEARPGERFAEIRVHRSHPTPTDSPFVWWTEAASAQPGVDYVDQAKVTQSFPKGKSSTSFFIKLLPKPTRSRPEVFYIAIGEPGGGPSLGQISHTAVWLPSNGHAS
ncbi:MAG: serine/threonine protein kinase [Pseudomonadota bacterium]|nr:serine/threonine protein kinase [Pseudomonadota bacterium]